VELTHLGMAVLMDDYNEISASPMALRFSDGIVRLAYIMLAGSIADQQEQDKQCCETSQRCKQCVAPKNKLHDPHTVWERRYAKNVERDVRRAAFEGRLPGERGLPSYPALFKLGTDPKSKRPRWMPTAACLDKKTGKALYEKTRKALGGVHLVENALWRARHYDYLMQVCSEFAQFLFGLTNVCTWFALGLYSSQQVYILVYMSLHFIRIEFAQTLHH